MIKKLFASQLRVNMASGVAVTLVNIAILAVAYPIYLHFLGYEQYGIWLALSVVLSVAQLGNLGIGQAVMKLVAEEYGRSDFKAAGQYMTCAIAVLAVSGTVVFAVIVLLKGPIVALFKFSEDDARAASRLLPYIACLSVYVFIVQAINAALSGLGRMDLANYVQTGGRLITVFVATVLLALGAGLDALLVGSAASYIFIHVISVAFARRVAPVRIFRVGNLSLSRTKRLLGFGSGILGSSILSMLLSPFNKLMLSRYSGVAIIPVYEIAYTGSMQVRALGEAGVRALMPEVSRLAANMTRQGVIRIERINRCAIGLIACCAVPFYAGLFLLAPLALQMWLGDRFVEPLPGAFRIALVASLLSLACVPSYYMLLGMGKVRHCVANHAILAGMSALLVLSLALTDERLSLAEVLVSLVTGTSISSIYVIFQNRRVLRAASSRITTAQDPVRETSICTQEASIPGACL